MNNKSINCPQVFEYTGNQLEIYYSILGSAQPELVTVLHDETENICRDYLTYGLSLEDLYSGANQGLVIATQNYDVNKGNFSTFAKHWIHIAILSVLMNYNYNALQPFLMDQYLMIKNRLVTFQSLHPTHSNTDTINALLTHDSRKYHVNKNELDIVEYTNSKVCSALESDQPNPFEVVCDKTFKEKCAQYISQLSERERKVLEMTFGFGPYEPSTIREIAEAMSISRARVLQIYTASLRKILMLMRNDVSRLNIELLDPYSQEVLKAFADKEVYWHGLDGLQDTGFTAEDVLNSLKLLI